ncbi:hypothetical protein AB0C29_11350 [Actinoplanes sp. NPDC048791]|uniref:hypothetical protein n=1 Tax=unclassified Actinoplanes TaxID=2626549 RepID=UPI0033E89531
MRFSSRSLVAAGVFVLALGAWGAPAQAHVMTGYQGLDKAWISSDHRSITVQDKECDNHGVFAVVNLSGGGSTSVSDPDGCSGNTGFRTTGAIASFYVCENQEGCGDTVRVQ